MTLHLKSQKRQHKKLFLPRKPKPKRNLRNPLLLIDPTTLKHDQLIRYTSLLREHRERQVAKNIKLWAMNRRSNISEKRIYQFEPRYPYLSDIYTDRHHQLVVKKSAQCGMSEFMVTQGMWLCDHMALTALYIFPTAGTMHDFVQQRVDQAILVSPYLQSRVGFPNNDSSKKFSRGLLVFRGGSETKHVKSVDADAVFLDEVDEIDPEIVSLAERRVGASSLKWLRKVSTPSFPDMGVDAEFQNSTQCEWFIRCPHCSTLQHMVGDRLISDDPRHPTPYVQCENPRCHRPLNRFAKGTWVPAQRDPTLPHGYHISKLFSPDSTLEELVAASLQLEEYKRQTYYNQDLGETYTPKGARLDEDILNECCMRGYKLSGRLDKLAFQTPGRIFLGADVGTPLIHVRISVYSQDFESKRALHIGTVRSFQELTILYKKYRCTAGVIDAHPEKRKARAWAQKVPHRRFVALFIERENDVKPVTVHPKENRVDINRSMVMDTMTVRYMSKRVVLPIDAKHIKGFYAQMKSPARVNRLNKDGETISKWIRTNKIDHYAMAECYEESAAEMVKQKLISGRDAVTNSTLLEQMFQTMGKREFEHA